MCTINKLLFLVVAVEVVRASDEQFRLLSDLFNPSRYNDIVRPVMNENDSVLVSVEVTLDQISDVDEKYQTLKAIIWLTQRWTDEYLVWNPADYNGLEEVRVPSTRLWLPDTVMYNTKNEGSNDPLMTVFTKMIINYNGSVDWSAPLTMISSCKVNVHHYPFDVQECNLRFGSWQHDARYIDYDIGKLDDELLSENGEWDLIGIEAFRIGRNYSCCPGKTYPDVTFRVKMQRKPLFYVVNLIVPCVVISTMAIVEFVLPCNSGEKVSLGITVLLSMTVFMLVIAENMPATSDSIPILARFYVVTIFLVSFSTVMTVLVLNLHHRCYRLPRWIRHVFLEVLAGVLCMREQITLPTEPTFYKGDGTHHFELLPQPGIDRNSGNEVKDEALLMTTEFMDVSENGVYRDGVNKDSYKRGTARLNRLVMEILGNVKFMAHRCQEKDHDETKKLEWQMVAKVVDRFFLIIYVICVFTMDLIMFLQIKHMDNSTHNSSSNSSASN